MHALQGNSLATTDSQAMLSTKDGNVAAVIWDFEQPDQKVSNRSFYTRVIPSRPAAPVHLRLTHLDANASYRLEVHRTGFHANDAYSAYLEMGSPKELTAAQIAHLSELTLDLPEMDKVVADLWSSRYAQIILIETGCLQPPRINTIALVMELRLR